MKTFLALLVATVAWAQTPAFEVALVKPNPSVTENSGENTAGGRFTATNDTLKQLVQLAFDVKGFQIVGGPGLDAAKYDIVATTGKSGDISERDLRPMLQALLADRFALKFHRETREMIAYSLTVAKSGPKLAAHQGAGYSSSSSSAGSMIATKATMAMLASRLERQLGRTVADRTGLTGEYDYRLTWAPDQAADATGPSIFTALEEQLGLRLDSAKGPVESIVIESAEKPSEN
jgi:uncharacterized protein (TIGR03435 family)